MISDTRLECQDAGSQRETTRFGPAGPPALDGFLSPLLHNVARTCRHFGISRQTFYRWQRRYGPFDLTSLEPLRIVLIAASRLGLRL
jgi:Helix-turn-helix domain